jgi:hypothetical protein
MTEDEGEGQSAAGQPPDMAEPAVPEVPVWLRELLLTQEVTPLPQESREDIWHSAASAIADHDGLTAAQFGSADPALDGDGDGTDHAAWTAGEPVHGDWLWPGEDPDVLDHGPLPWPGGEQDAPADGATHIDGGHW